MPPIQASFKFGQMGGVDYVGHGPSLQGNWDWDMRLNLNCVSFHHDNVNGLNDSIELILCGILKLNFCYFISVMFDNYNS